MIEKHQRPQHYTPFHEKRKLDSHIVWHEATGYWPDWETKREVIHHIDGFPLNNELNNLQLMTHSEHRSLHTKGENHPNFGKTASKETRAKISASQIGNKNHRWTGDLATEHAKYQRRWKARRRD